MGRPPIELDVEQLDKCLAIQCTQVEIASLLNMSIETLNQKVKDQFGMTFLEYSRQKRGNGVLSARRRGFQELMNGKKFNTVLWIFWMKNYGGMSDEGGLNDDLDTDLEFNLS